MNSQYEKECEHLDLILRAAGTKLRYYTMKKSLDDLHEAIRKVMSESYTEGYNAAKAEAQK